MVNTRWLLSMTAVRFIAIHSGSAERQKTDIRKDMTMEMRHVASGERAAASTALYDRSAANQALLERRRTAADKKQFDQSQQAVEQIVEKDPKDFVAWAEWRSIRFAKKSILRLTKLINARWRSSRIFLWLW